MTEIPGVRVGLVAVVLVFGCIGIAYWYLLPRPLHGIPYNRTSATRLLGDLPDMLQWTMKTGEPYYFLPKLCQDLRSPIVQVFPSVGKRPWVVLADEQEAYDIMLRRTAEFDRAPGFSGFRAWLPNGLVALPSNEQWRHQRRIFSDTMSPNVVQELNAPHVHAAFSRLGDVWAKKIELVGDSLLDVNKDIVYATLDALWASNFGNTAGALDLQIKNLSTPAQADSSTGVIRFQDAVLPDEVACAIILPSSAHIMTKSPLGYLHQKLALHFVPRLRSAMQAKDRLLDGEISAAMQRLNGKTAERGSIKFVCAIDVMIGRAQRIGEVINSDSVRDDIFGYITGGFETVASAIRWGVLLLAASPRVQNKLRAAIEDEHADGDLPSTKAIDRASVPYLDAFIEETIRIGNPVPANMRVATCDTQILGYDIPKGTAVVFPTWGPTHTAPAIPVADKARSTSSRANAGKIGSWEEADMCEFKPERWLKLDENGQEVFDRFSGPALVFGAGARGCPGKKLAYLQMRIFFTLILWRFEFLRTEVRMQGRQTLTRRPENVWVRLRKLRS